MIQSVCSQALRALQSQSCSTWAVLLYSMRIKLHEFCRSLQVFVTRGLSGKYDKQLLKGVHDNMTAAHVETQ